MEIGNIVYLKNVIYHNVYSFVFPLFKKYEEIIRNIWWSQNKLVYLQPIINKVFTVKAEWFGILGSHDIVFRESQIFHQAIGFPIVYCHLVSVP